MWKTLSIIAVLASLTACVIALKALDDREESIRRAIRQHDAEIVQRYAPLLREMSKRGNVRTLTLDPESVQELVAALAEVARQSAAANQLLNTAHPAGATDSQVDIDEPSTAVEVSMIDDDTDDTSARRPPRSSVNPMPPRDGRGNAVALVPRLDETLAVEGEVVYFEDRIVKMRLPDGSPEPVDGAPNGGLSPIWSNDSSKIAYIAADDSGQYDVYVLDVASRESTRLTSTVERESSLAWSPGNSRMAFEVSGENESGIRVLRFDAPEDDGVVINRATMPAWAPDGQRIAYVRDAAELWVAHVGGEPRPVLKATAKESGVLWRPLWLSNDQVVVSQVRTVERNGRRDIDSRLLAIDPTTGESRPVATPPRFILALCASPDRKFLLTL